MIHLGHNITRRDTDADREARRRAAATEATFGNRNQRGPLIDFSAKGAPAAPSSGMGGSGLDLYSPAFKAEIAARDERTARMDRLPAAVQCLTTEAGVTDLELLETIAIVHRASTTMNGPAQVFASDMGRSIGVTTQRAEALLADAVRRGFITQRPGNYFTSKL